VAGWSYQWASQLNWAPDSWTAPVDAVRTPPSADTTTATIEQVRQMMTMLPADGAVPTFVFAAGYDPAGLTCGLTNVRAQVLVRVRGDRVFFSDPPGCPGYPSRGGRPRRHGQRLKLSHDKTAPTPDAEDHLEDPRYEQLAASSATYECPGPGHATLKSSLQLGPGGVASSSCGYRYSRQPTEISKSPVPSAPKGTPRPPCTRCRVIKKTA